MSEPWIDTQRAMLSCSNIMISYNNGVYRRAEMTYFGWYLCRSECTILRVSIYTLQLSIKT